MKRSILIFSISMLLFGQGFAQPNLTKSTQRIWNSDEQTWDPWMVKTWEFDAQGREVMRLAQFDFNENQNSEGHQLYLHKYDENSNLISWRNEYLDDGYTIISQNDYSYNEEGILKEHIYRYKPTNADTLSRFWKKVYSYKDNGRKVKVKRFFWYQLPRGYHLFSEFDTLFDQNDCMVELYQQYYSVNDPSQPNRVERKIMTRDNQCRILTQEYQALDLSTSTFIPINRESKVYERDGKRVITKYEKYWASLQEWETTTIVTIDQNDDYQPVRSQFLYPNSTPPQETIVLSEYDHAGRLISRQSHRNDTLELHDRITYFLDENERVIQKNIKRENFTTPSSISQVFYYSYYCDGQLKMEGLDNLPSVFQTTFEYDTGGDCPIEKGEEELNVFPNPSKGTFEISSNLLSGNDAIIRIFSVTGKEVFMQKVPELSGSKHIELEHLLPGSYYVVVLAGELYVGKRVLIRD